MNIAITGSKELLKELTGNISSHNDIKEFSLEKVVDLAGHHWDMVVDVNFDTQPHERWEKLKTLNSQHYFLGALQIQLGVLPFFSESELKQIFGIGNLWGMLGRNVLEYTSPIGVDCPETLIRQLGFEKGIRVNDRVGMVTMRTLSMIVNEAYFTLQEGTASKEDIDMGMKLGTAYPMGPFEWSQKIGIQHIYQLLKKLHEDTFDERYKVCNLLQTEALKRGA
jgi:3-hydroxybutyryl-CoA dehydrogenase